ncbi:triphosphoribosyl-dephospho-CoA synthase MdcB [Anaeromyxobacter oryzae]|uniref:triphosphoribosyl-dephospho-CoA synthase n=1 Tax=Anaeromyxobacter oryzae TaxID=2918170 RepID=A0ABN6MZ04_9BACT|nr:triphosphoribosyl-dephospho-CoA synthase MdcB [Anaeromyxobacter oryzae]BDG05500.1 putative 2-(5''-triphosphoribosyl)-3'-dephosphocoenzyme-A synthase [Anaeromyxobacter oryzae]
MKAAAPATREPRLAKAAEVIARAAAAALREELATAPKPGLVTLRDPGAHRDMDARTFLASLRALRPDLAAAACAGVEGAPFEALRALGRAAEARMLVATGGVNTHRGAIFGLGLLAAAAGRLAAAGRPWTAPALADTVREAFSAGIWTALPPAPGSHGAGVARRYGAGGAREEAAAGFPHVMAVGVPALRASLARGAGRRAAAVQCLLALVATVPDTNVLHRGGPTGLAFARAAARVFLRDGGVHRDGWEVRARAIHEAFVRRGISPGGSADLLAASLFVHRLDRMGAPG